jgi:hypothetical protein
LIAKASTAPGTASSTNVVNETQPLVDLLMDAASALEAPDAPAAVDSLDHVRARIDMED